MSPPDPFSPRRRKRVLVVDDSALFRELVMQALAADPELEVVGGAPDPQVAWAMIKARPPDVVTLDIEMPKMDGLTFLDLLMTHSPLPVVLVSSLTTRGCETTLKAFELGAVEVVAKPTSDLRESYAALAADLVSKVKLAASARPRRGGVRSAVPAAPAPTIRAAPAGVNRTSAGAPAGAPGFRTTHAVIAVGASTGGTEALATFLSGLPPDSPGLVMVQHMQERFLTPFAARLDGLGAIRVREAKHGDRVLMGHALLAPGGKQLRLVRDGAQFRVAVEDGAPVSGHRPSVDVLFHSCATAAGRNAIGVIMTGMGADGAAGMKAMHDAGARTLAQDEASCVVFGMPREAIARGGVDEILPIEKLAAAALQAAGS